MTGGSFFGGRGARNWTERQFLMVRREARPSWWTSLASSCAVQSSAAEWHAPEAGQRPCTGSFGFWTSDPCRSSGQQRQASTHRSGSTACGSLRLMREAGQSGASQGTRTAYFQSRLTRLEGSLGRVGCPGSIGFFVSQLLLLLRSRSWWTPHFHQRDPGTVGSDSLSSWEKLWNSLPHRCRYSQPSITLDGSWIRSFRQRFSLGRTRTSSLLSKVWLSRLSGQSWVQ